MTSGGSVRPGEAPYSKYRVVENIWHNQKKYLWAVTEDGRPIAFTVSKEVAMRWRESMYVLGFIEVDE